jgi:NAD(P)-dependent dehydrogenase (short-subunit alcohol dehydrogenase family)
VLNLAGVRVAGGVRPQIGGPGKSPPTAASTHHGLLTSPADCERVVKEVVDQHGRLDILISRLRIWTFPLRRCPDQSAGAPSNAGRLGTSTPPHPVVRRTS